MEAVIFIGIQATGKSTFYKQYFFRTHVRINLDMLRTRHREYLLMMACIEAKQRFVSDNTNATRDIRARTIQLAKPAGFQIVGYYFRSTLVEAIARNAQRLGEERIPEAGIRTMFGRLELPSFAEGFDKLFYVSISQDNRFIVDRWHDEIR